MRDIKQEISKMMNAENSTTYRIVMKNKSETILGGDLSEISVLIRRIDLKIKAIILQELLEDAELKELSIIIEDFNDLLAETFEFSRNDKRRKNSPYIQRKLYAESSNRFNKMSSYEREFLFETYRRRIGKRIPVLLPIKDIKKGSIIIEIALSVSVLQLFSQILAATVIKDVEKAYGDSELSKSFVKLLKKRLDHYIPKLKDISVDSIDSVKEETKQIQHVKVDSRDNTSTVEVDNTKKYTFDLKF